LGKSKEETESAQPRQFAPIRGVAAVIRLRGAIHAGPLAIDESAADRNADGGNIYARNFARLGTFPPSVAGGATCLRHRASRDGTAGCRDTTRTAPPFNPPPIVVPPVTPPPVIVVPPTTPNGVPEPSSLLAGLSGLAAAAGFGVRRRRDATNSDSKK